MMQRMTRNEFIYHFFEKKKDFLFVYREEKKMRNFHNKINFRFDVISIFCRLLVHIPFSRQIIFFFISQQEKERRTEFKPIRLDVRKKVINSFKPK